MGPTCQSNSTLSSSFFLNNIFFRFLQLQLLDGASPAAPKLRAPPSADEVAHSRRPSMPLPMAAPKLARAALSKLSHGRSRLSRRVSPAAPSSMLLLRADELAHGLRPSPLPPGSTESRLALDELAHGRRRQSRRARKRSDSLRPWPRPSAREEEDAEPLAHTVL